MSKMSSIALAIVGLVVSTHTFAQVTFFERDGFGGRSYSTEDAVMNLASSGFNDRASSMIVQRDRWEACEDAGFRGRCMVLSPGHYPSLAQMGLNDRISSLRPVGYSPRPEEERDAPPPPLLGYDGHRRDGERLYQAQVTAVRAVLGPPQQRCWMEREQVSQPRRGDASVPGGIAGAVIGGILGHQLGGGAGRDLATVGGVVAGAAVGANLGRDNNSVQPLTQDVQRCSNETSQGPPEYWDVTYVFRGQEHHMQVTTPPGDMVTVNRRGEPRVPVPAASTAR